MEPRQTTAYHKSFRGPRTQSALARDSSVDVVGFKVDMGGDLDECNQTMTKFARQCAVFAAEQAKITEEQRSKSRKRRRFGVDSRYHNFRGGVRGEDKVVGVARICLFLFDHGQGRNTL